MLAKKKDSKQSSMFFGLEDMLNQKHSMYILPIKCLGNYLKIRSRPYIVWTMVVRQSRYD